jgi:hypothetical protein
VKIWCSSGGRLGDRCPGDTSRRPFSLELLFTIRNFASAVAGPPSCPALCPALCPSPLPLHTSTHVAAGARSRNINFFLFFFFNFFSLVPSRWSNYKRNALGRITGAYRRALVAALRHLGLAEKVGLDLRDSLPFMIKFYHSCKCWNLRAPRAGCNACINYGFIKEGSMI